MNFSIISAMDEHRGIGKANGLPWHLSADLKHFAATTKNGTVIMGRKTWESLPDAFKPLKNRLNIVISRGDYEMPEGVLLAHSLDEALNFAGNINPVEKAFVIGGASLYAEAILHPLCNELFLTEVSGVFDCDAFFPEILDDFKKAEEGELLSEESTDGKINFRFARYMKG